MSANPSLKRIFYAGLMVGGYFLLQAVMILLHEFTHSTLGWALGYSGTPMTVVWGNLITMQGWDEGIPYDALFHGRGHNAEAAIGGAPLAMHGVFVVILISCLLHVRACIRPIVFFALYWFLILNLAELIAYFWMRPFLTTGDTGRFNQGMDLSPWGLFACGSLFLAGALWVLHSRILPEIASGLGGQRWAQILVIAATGFVLFLWASGLRFLVLYPDPLWRVGLIGLALFIAWLLLELPRANGKRVSE